MEAPLGTNVRDLLSKLVDEHAGRRDGTSLQGTAAHPRPTPRPRGRPGNGQSGIAEASRHRTRQQRLNPLRNAPSAHTRLSPIWHFMQPRQPEAMTHVRPPPWPSRATNDAQLNRASPTRDCSPPHVLRHHPPALMAPHDHSPSTVRAPRNIDAAHAERGRLEGTQVSELPCSPSQPRSPS